MNIWYFNHYAALPNQGVSERPFQLGAALRRNGHDVLIVCASNHHLRTHPVRSPYTGNRTVFDGIGYWHIETRQHTGNGILRFMNMMDFAFGARRLHSKVAGNVIERPDVIIASSAHIFTYPPAYRLSRQLKSKLVFEVRDIWPRALVEIAGVSACNPIVRVMGYIERHAYRKSAAVISLQPGAFAHMQPKGLHRNRFHCIPNGVSYRQWQRRSSPLPEIHRKLFDGLRRREKLIVVYAGSHGPPNALDQILDLNRVEHKERPYHFVCIGDGVSKPGLVERAKKDRIDFVTFLPKIPMDAVPEALNHADICFIGWQDKPIYRMGISPNKLGDYFLSDRPILHAVHAWNDPVREAGAGISVAPYQPQALDAALRQFAAMTPEQRKKMGMRGRAFALEKLEWRILGEKFNRILTHL